MRGNLVVLNKLCNVQFKVLNHVQFQMQRT